MTINLMNKSAASASMMAALKDGDESAYQQAFEDFSQAVANEVADSYREAVASNDARIMAERGFRTLTSQERSYYEGVIGALRSETPQQAFAELPDKALPTTVFQSVLKDVQTSHPLLSAVSPQYVGAVTRWVKAKHTKTMAAWGELNSAIAKEITDAIEVVEVKQGKLSAFAVVSLDMLELGPEWLDLFVRTVVGEAYACAMELGIVSGKGIKGEPVGLDRDIHEGVSVNSTTGYPAKAAVAATSFDPEGYGALVAKLVKNEQGADKPVDIVNGGSLALIVNNTTYLTKVMPAIRQLVNGTYMDAYPVATKTIASSAVEDNKAILALLDEYGLFVGGDRGIQYSDDFKFLEDQRTFKLVSYAAGRAADNTSAIVLDLSKLEGAAAPVKVKGTVSTKAAS